MLASLLLFGPRPAVAANIVVNSANSDVTAGNAECTLPEAINNANNGAVDTTGGDCTTGTVGLDQITFTIAVGPQTIALGADLPPITEPVLINGYTQTGAPNASENTIVDPGDGDNAVILIMVDGGGNACVDFANGSDGSTIQGLSIVNCGGPGIFVETGADTITIRGNFIGVEPDGTTANPNGDVGVETEAAGTKIGGTNPGDRNLIGGNASDGIFVGPDASGATIQGNRIGTNAAGTGAVPNSLGSGNPAVDVEFSDHITIGGLNPGEGNLISGNDEIGIGVIVSSAILIQGNLVGTDVTGGIALANNSAGIDFEDGQDVTIDGNLVSGNAEIGIGVIGSSQVTIRKNKVGTDIGGTLAIPNGLSGGFEGVAIANSDHLTLGGPTASDGNLISGNAAAGVFIRPVFGPALSAITIQNNKVGTNATGRHLFRMAP